MSRNKNVVPEARAALDKFKMEAASEVGVNLKQGYNGDLTSKEAGSVGGQMVKKLLIRFRERFQFYVHFFDGSFFSCAENANTPLIGFEYIARFFRCRVYLGRA